jgi:hypothetical protein
MDQFTTEGGLQTIHANKTDFVTLISKPEESKNRKFAAVSTEASLKRPGQFNINTYAASTLEEAVDLGNTLLGKIQLLDEERAGQEVGQVVEELKKPPSLSVNLK